ncbi:MAG: acyl-CoA thioesterase [Bdellovibrionales bacterium]
MSRIVGEEGTPEASSVVMTELVLPYHTNALNSVFGGTIMSWIDIAAAISAGKHCQKDVVTASIDALHFIAPAYVGWVVEVYARVNYVSRTSVEVGVRVESIAPKNGKRVHTASAYLTFVALDDSGKATKAPPLKLKTDDDRRRAEKATVRREYRLLQKKEILKKEVEA